MREPTPHDPFDEFFDDLLRGDLASTAAEHRAIVARHLATALTIVKNRRTPLRGVEGFGSDGACRLAFADGTTLLARSTPRGGLSLVAVAVSRGSTVLLTDVREDGIRVHAALGWGDHSVEIEVVGGDQPD